VFVGVGSLVSFPLGSHLGVLLLHLEGLLSLKGEVGFLFVGSNESFVLLLSGGLLLVELGFQLVLLRSGDVGFQLSLLLGHGSTCIDVLGGEEFSVDGSSSLLFFDLDSVFSQSFSVLSHADSLEVGFLLGHLSEGGFVSCFLSIVHGLLFGVLAIEGGLVISGFLGVGGFGVSVMLGHSSFVSSDFFGLLLQLGFFGVSSLENQSFMESGFLGENGLVRTHSVSLGLSSGNSGLSFSGEGSNSLGSASLGLVDSGGMGLLGSGSLSKTDLEGLGSGSLLGLSHQSLHLLLEGLGASVNLLHLQSLHDLSLHVHGSGLGSLQDGSSLQEELFGSDLVLLFLLHHLLVLHG